MKVDRDFSLKGWRVYNMPDLLDIGYKELARLERLNDIEIYIQDGMVFIRDFYKHEIYANKGTIRA